MIGIMKCLFTSFASLRHRLTTMRDDFLFFFKKLCGKILFDSKWMGTNIGAGAGGRRCWQEGPGKGGRRASAGKLATAKCCLTALQSHRNG